MRHWALAIVVLTMIAGVASGLNYWSEQAQLVRPQSHSVQQEGTTDESESLAVGHWGQHLIVGYDDPEALKTMIRQGVIGGVFLNRQNTRDRSSASLSAEIASFQAAAKEAGLPQLFIAVDQEGGVVEKASPPLTKHASLASIMSQHPTTWQAPVREMAASQASELASIGVNTNFAPVVDLDPDLATHRRDEARLDDRMIATSAATVSEVASLYASQMKLAGIMPTFKHFPGLGPTIEDTHSQQVYLDTSYEDMWATHLVPYRFALEPDDAIMVSHVIWRPIDPTRAASHSEKVIQNYIRTGLQFDGLVITDDMTMDAIVDSSQGIGTASLEALNAGVDLVLIAGHPEMAQEVIAFLATKAEAGSFNGSRLKESAKRLANARDRL